MTFAHWTSGAWGGPLAPAAAALSLLAPLAAWGLEIESVDPGYAGRLNRVVVTGATPGANVFVAFGETPGPTPVPGCPGLVVDSLVQAVIGPKAATPNGRAVLAVTVPEALVGRSVQAQAVEPGICVVSAADTVTFPPTLELELDAEATAQLTSDPVNEEGLGRALSTAGDVDGDGVTDFLVGVPLRDGGGGAYLVRGPLAGQRQIGSDLGALLLGDEQGDSAGSAVAPAGDVNSDGYADILVGAPLTRPDTHGEVYLIHGPISGESELTAGAARLVGAPQDKAGWSVSSAGDVNDDGVLDVIVGAPSDNGIGAGQAYVVRGPVVGEIDLPTQADTILYGTPGVCEACVGDRAGHVVASLRDHDGDGFHDVLVAASTRTADGGQTSSAGAVYVVNGPLAAGSYSLPVIAGASIESEQGGQRLGEYAADAGDTNGDGYRDLLVAPTSKTAMVFLGPVVGERLPETAEATFVGPEVQGINGAYSIGDFNGDGFSDLGLGSPYLDEIGTNGGAGYLFLAPVLGTVDLSTAQVRYLGEVGSQAGDLLASAGDVDDDGYDDLLVGAPGFAFPQGTAYLISGWSL